ncbi:hypothetical protein V2G26_014094 [Clonostachys chloroleuca]
MPVFPSPGQPTIAPHPIPNTQTTCQRGHTCIAPYNKSRSRGATVMVSPMAFQKASSTQQRSSPSFTSARDASVSTQPYPNPPIKIPTYLPTDLSHIPRANL